LGALIVVGCLSAPMAFPAMHGFELPLLIGIQDRTNLVIVSWWIC